MEVKEKTDVSKNTEVKSIFNKEYYVTKLRDAGGIKSRNVKGVIQMCLLKIPTLTVGLVLAARTIFPVHAVLKWIKLGLKMTPEFERQFTLFAQLAEYLKEHVEDDDIEEWKKIMDETKYTLPAEGDMGWAYIFQQVPELCLKVKEKSSKSHQRIEIKSKSTGNRNSDTSTEKENLSLKGKDNGNIKLTSDVKKINKDIEEDKDTGKLRNQDAKLGIDTRTTNIKDKRKEIYVKSQQAKNVLIPQGNDDQQRIENLSSTKEMGVDSLQSGNMRKNKLLKIPLQISAEKNEVRTSEKKTDKLIFSMQNERPAKDAISESLKESISESDEKSKKNERDQEFEAVFDIDALITEELDYDMISSPDVENEEEDDNVEGHKEAECEDNTFDEDVTPDIEYERISSPESENLMQIEDDNPENHNSEEVGGGEEFKEYLYSELEKSGLINTIKVRGISKKVLAKDKKSYLRVVLVLAAICHENFSDVDVTKWIDKTYGITNFRLKKAKMKRQLYMYHRLLNFLLHRVPKRLLGPWKSYMASVKYKSPVSSKEDWVNIFGKTPSLCRSMEVNELLGLNAYIYKNPYSKPIRSSIDVFQSLEHDRISSDDSDFEKDDISLTKSVKSSEETTSKRKDPKSALEVENIDSSEGSDLEDDSRDTTTKEKDEETLYTQMIDSPEDPNLLKEQEQHDGKMESVSPISSAVSTTNTSKSRISSKKTKKSYALIKPSSRTFRNIVILGKEKYANDFRQFDNNLNLTYHEANIKFDENDQVELKKLQAELKKNSHTMWIILTDFSTWSKTSNFCSNTFRENDCKESLSIYSATDLQSSEVCNKVVSFVSNVLTKLDKSSSIIVAPVTPQAVLCAPDDHLMLQDFHDILHFSQEAKEIPMCKETSVKHFNSFGEDYLKIVEQVMKKQNLPTQLVEEFVKKRLPVLDGMEDPLQCQSWPGENLSEWRTFMKTLLRWLSVSSGPGFDSSSCASPGLAGMSSNLSGVSSGSLSPTPTVAAASSRLDTPPSPISRTSTPLSGVSSCPLSPAGANDKSPGSISPKVSGASVVSPASVVSLCTSATASPARGVSPEPAQLSGKPPTGVKQITTLPTTNNINKQDLPSGTTRMPVHDRRTKCKMIINHYSKNLKVHHIMKLAEACGNVIGFQMIRGYTEEQPVEYSVDFANLYDLNNALDVLKDLKVLDTRLNVKLKYARGPVYKHDDNDKNIAHCRAKIDQLFKEMNLFPITKVISPVAGYKPDIQFGPIVNPSGPVPTSFYEGAPPANVYSSNDLINSVVPVASWDDKEADLARKATEFVAANEAKLFVAANEAKIAELSRSLSKDGRNTERDILDRGRQKKERRMKSPYTKKYGRLSSDHSERNYKSPERFRSRSQERLRSRSPKYGKISRSPDWEELNRRSPLGRRPSSPYRREDQLSRSPERARSRNTSWRGGHGSGSSPWEEDRLAPRRSKSPIWKDESSRASHESWKTHKTKNLAWEEKITVRIPNEKFRSRSPPWVEDKVYSRSPDRRLHSRVPERGGGRLEGEAEQRSRHSLSPEWINSPEERKRSRSRSPRWMGEISSRSPEWIDSPEHLSRFKSPKRKRSLSPEWRQSRGASPKYHKSKERHDVRKDPEQSYTEIEITHIDVDKALSNKIMLLLTPIIWQCGGVNVPDLRLRLKSKNREQAAGPSTPQRLIYKFKNKSTAIIVAKFLNDFRIPDLHLQVKALVDNIDKVHIDQEEKRAVITTLMHALRSNQSIFITHLQHVGARPGAFTNNIFTYKTKKCKDVNQRCKIFKSCVFYHSKADQRRDIRVIKYMDIDCKNGPDDCPQGEKCNKSHNKAESIFHPRRIHKNICQEWYAEKKCARSDVCISAHPESPEILFNDIWRDLFVSGLKQTYQYLVGAVQNMRFLKAGLPGIYILVVTPTMYVANWLAGAVMDLADDHQQEVAVVTEDCGDIGNAKIVVGTPGGVVGVVRSGRVEVSRTLAGLILDDASLLLTEHRTHIHTLAQILNVHYGATELDLNRVVVAEQIHQWEVDVLSILLNTTFVVLGEVVPESDIEPVPARDPPDGEGVVTKSQKLDSQTPRFKGAASLGSPISPTRPRDWSPIRKSIKAPSPPRWTDGDKSASSVFPRGQSQGFSVRSALTSLTTVANNIGVIGHSLKALLSRAEQCTNDSGILAVMRERDNATLLEMVKTKLDDQADSATGIQQAKLFKDAAVKTKLLMDQMSGGVVSHLKHKKYYGLDIDLIAMVTLGKDMPYIIKFIKNSLELEDVVADKKTISEIYETICERHQKMNSRIQDQSAGMQPTAGEIIKKLQMENISFGLPTSIVDQRISGPRTAQINNQQSEYPKNQSTNIYPSNWESRKNIQGNNEENYNRQSSYPSDKWPQKTQTQDRDDSIIHHNNPSYTNSQRHHPPPPPPPMAESQHSYSSHGPTAKSYPSSPFGECAPYPPPYSSDSQPAH
ncbi:unnamed protein product, partial [Meganyctiphanes norvegica]